MILKTAKFGIIMMLAPAMCLTGRPYSTLPPNETPGAGSFFTGLIDDVRILRLRSGQVLQPSRDALANEVGGPS